MKPTPGASWRATIGAALNVETDVSQKGNHALLVAETSEDKVIDWLHANRGDVRIMGYGKLMEVYKDMGLPGTVAKKYGLRKMAGTHAIGHTRMATESAVTTEHSHPFTPAPDMCLVHNGSLSNHNNLRKWLKKQGQSFDTDNDSEVAARYFAHRLHEGATLRKRWRQGSAISTASSPSPWVPRMVSRCCATASPASRPYWPRMTTGWRWPPSSAPSPICPTSRRRRSGSRPGHRLHLEPPLR
jgi:hypothetical protein